MIKSKFPKELAKLRQLIPDDVWELLELSKAVIAGGTVTSLFTRRDINDIDVYFRTKRDLYEFLTGYFGYPSELDIDIGKLGVNIRPSVLTGKSATFKINSTVEQTPIQCIIYRTFSTVEDIFESFDYTINMGALDCATGTFYLHDKFMQHNSQRYLHFNSNTSFPFISALRIDKYVQRGYYISKMMYMQIMLTINNLQLTSWEQLIEQLGGMYGYSIRKFLPVHEPFSIARAIQAFETIEVPELYEKLDAASFGLSDIYEQHPNMKYRIEEITPTETDVSTRYFKNVKLMRDDRGRRFYHSHFDTGFQYVLDREVQGKAGIYGYLGDRVINGQYWASNDTVVLEFVPTTYTQKDKVDSSKQVVLYGGVKPVAVYTKEQFVRMVRGYKQVYFDDDKVVALTST